MTLVPPTPVSAPPAPHGPAAEVMQSWATHTPVPTSVAGEGLMLVLESLRALGGVRRQVRAFLAAGCGAATQDACEDAVERAVLVIDELTSNALRHGLPPSSLQVRDEPGRWLVTVCDSAPDRIPQPAVGRPAGQGGYGLYVITDLTNEHGVHYATDHKLVWASFTKPVS